MIKKWVRPVVAWIAVFICTLSAAASPKMLVPGGCTIGVKLYTQGLMITGFEAGSAAKAAGLKKGDVIIRVDGETIHTVAALRDALEEDRVVMTILRNGKEASFCVKPQKDAIGAYVKDSIAGIGTVTYYDPETGTFGALGHGVCDAETEQPVPVSAGVVVPSAVSEIRKGTGGDPGELKGKFDVNQILGEVQRNTKHGIFGTMHRPLPGEPLPVAAASEVETGGAVILANVNGREVCTYDVEIVKIFADSENADRNLLLKIIDPALLETTGGIVQGMSGSPICQNGKIVGAVTHVLVNDPTMGYGIFIENMLDGAG